MERILNFTIQYRCNNLHLLVTGLGANEMFSKLIQRLPMIFNCEAGNENLVGAGESVNL